MGVREKSPNPAGEYRPGCSVLLLCCPPFSVQRQCHGRHDSPVSCSPCCCWRRPARKRQKATSQAISENSYIQHEINSLQYLQSPRKQDVERHGERDLTDAHPKPCQGWRGFLLPAWNEPGRFRFSRRAPEADVCLSGNLFLPGLPRAGAGAPRTPACWGSRLPVRGLFACIQNLYQTRTDLFQAKQRGCAKVTQPLVSSPGTEGRTRTVKLLPAGDFESPVSTNSTTPAKRRSITAMSGETRPV